MKFIIVASLIVWSTNISPKHCEGHRILGVFPFQARSHFMMFEALMKGLARKGHQVDVVSFFPQKRPHPNYNDIIELSQNVPSLINNVTYEQFTTEFTGNMIRYVAENCGNTVCEILGDPMMTKLLKDSPRPSYDIVITEIFGAHCYMALGHHFKAPVIGLTSSALYLWGNDLIANPPNLAYVPNNFFNYNAPMKFWQRLYNVIYNAYYNIAFQIYIKPQDEIIKKYFGNDAPTVKEAEKSLALILANSHPSLNGNKPSSPALIEVGGLHVQDDDTQLPQDLKEWMDNSSAGFIYFTFGSMITIESFPTNIINVIYKSLGKISPIRVLIKIPNPKILPPGLPENFRTFKWSPQIKILQHKNIKAFITHGGLMSTQEAIHYGVPLIGMPLFADQFVNVDRYTNLNIAIKVNPHTMTEKNLDAALNEILYNPLYKNTMSKVSAEFLDRPMSALDTGIWWVEYIGRHGTDALKTPAMDLTWFQIDLLDVYGFIVLIAILAIFVVIKFIKFIINIYGINAASKTRYSKKNA